MGFALGHFEKGIKRAFDAIVKSDAESISIKFDVYLLSFYMKIKKE